MQLPCFGFGRRPLCALSSKFHLVGGCMTAAKAQRRPSLLSLPRQARKLVPKARLVAVSVTGGGCWVHACKSDPCYKQPSAAQLPLITDMLALASNHTRCQQHGAMVRWQCTQTQLRATRQTIPTQPAGVHCQRGHHLAKRASSQPGQALGCSPLPSTQYSSIPRLDLRVIGTRPGCFTPTPARVRPAPIALLSCHLAYPTLALTQLCGGRLQRRSVQLVRSCC